MKHGFGWGRSVLVVTCVLSLWTVGTPARADLRVEWDCFLPEAGVECREVANAFFPSVPGVERAADAPDLSLRLRSVEVASHRRYFADFRGRPLGARGPGEEEVAFTLIEEAPTAAGADRTLMLLVALLQRGIVPYLHVATPGAADDGVLRLEAAAADGGAAAPSPDEARSGWYLRPSLSGEIVRAGVRVISLQSGLELNWSEPSWRWLASASASYRHLDLELPDGRLQGGFWQARGRSVLARSLGGGFDAAVIGGARREPQNNLDVRAEAGLGLEWVHREFLRADEGNLGARYQLLGTWDRYETETVLGQTARLYPRQALSLFARWHLEAVDLEADVTAGAVADQPELWDLGSDLTITLRLAQGLDLELSGSIIYRGGAVHEPADATALDPVASVVSGSDFGRLTYVSAISLGYSFGNALLRSQDQRWR